MADRRSTRSALARYGDRPDKATTVEHYEELADTHRGSVFRQYGRQCDIVVGLTFSDVDSIISALVKEHNNTLKRGWRTSEKAMHCATIKGLVSHLRKVNEQAREDRATAAATAR